MLQNSTSSGSSTLQQEQRRRELQLDIPVSKANDPFDVDSPVFSAGDPFQSPAALSDDFSDPFFADTTITKEEDDSLVVAQPPPPPAKSDGSNSNAFPVTHILRRTAQKRAQAAAKAAVDLSLAASSTRRPSPQRGVLLHADTQLERKVRARHVSPQKKRGTRDEETTTSAEEEDDDAAQQEPKMSSVYDRRKRFERTLQANKPRSSSTVTPVSYTHLTLPTIYSV